MCLKHLELDSLDCLQGANVQSILRIQGARGVQCGAVHHFSLFASEDRRLEICGEQIECLN